MNYFKVILIVMASMAVGLIDLLTKTHPLIALISISCLILISFIFPWAIFIFLLFIALLLLLFLKLMAVKLKL